MNRNFGSNSGSRDRGFSDRPRSNDFGNAPPVNVGEELDVKIEAVGEKGDGVAKKNGFVIFVPGVKEGQNVRVRITRVLRKVGFADLIGPSTGAPAKEEAAQSEPEEEYSEEKDSDNFGEEESTDAPAETEETPAEDSEASEDFGDEEEEK